MGDRCYMCVYVHESDADRFSQLVGMGSNSLYAFQATSEPDKDGFVEFTDEEVNYGNTDDLPNDIPFFGWHGDGGDYGSADFASDADPDGRFDYVSTGRDGGYVVKFNEESGEPEMKDIEEVRAFIQFRNKVKALMRERGKQPA